MTSIRCARAQNVATIALLSMTAFEVPLAAQNSCSGLRKSLEEKRAKLARQRWEIINDLILNNPGPELSNDEGAADSMPAKRPKKEPGEPRRPRARGGKTSWWYTLRCVATRDGWCSSTAPPSS